MFGKFGEIFGGAPKPTEEELRSKQIQEEAERLAAISEKAKKAKKAKNNSLEPATFGVAKSSIDEVGSRTVGDLKAQNKEEGGSGYAGQEVEVDATFAADWGNAMSNINRRSNDIGSNQVDHTEGNLSSDEPLVIAKEIDNESDLSKNNEQRAA